MNEPSTGIRTCGRPTRSGKPCRARIYGGDVACGQHITQHERELAEASRRGRQEGWQQGYETGAAAAKQRVEWLERRVKELEQRLDDATRVHEVDGDQVVEVDGRYAYRWRGEAPLAVGDRVVLPENPVSRAKHASGPYEGTVTGLGTTYRGELSLVLRRALAGEA